MTYYEKLLLKGIEARYLSLELADSIEYPAEVDMTEDMIVIYLN